MLKNGPVVARALLRLVPLLLGLRLAEASAVGERVPTGWLASAPNEVEALPPEAMTRAELIAFFSQRIQACFRLPKLDRRRFVELEIWLTESGGLARPLALVTKSPEPDTALLEAAARQAVQGCAPFAVPERLRPSYPLWRRLRIRFTPLQATS